MSKITQYNALTATQPDDLLVIVDVHDTSMAPTGTDKKVTVGTLLAGAGFSNPMTTLGDIMYENATPAAARLPGDASNARKFLRSQSIAGVAQAPAWDTLQVSDIPLQPWQFTPEASGAKGDGKAVMDGAMTVGASGTTLTCATSAPFTAGDVGKVITVEGAGTTLAGTSTASALSTTISAFVSATQVTLAASAGTTVTGRTVIWGTDDATALKNMMTAAAAYATANRYYAELVFQPHIYMVAGALVQGGTSKTNSQIPLPVVPISSNPTMVLKLTGTRSNSGPEMFGVAGDTPMAAVEGTVICSTLTGQAYSATFGQPAVIGGPTVEQGYTGGLSGLWNNLMVVVDGLTVLVPPIASLTGIDLTTCVKAEVPWLRTLAAAPAPILAGATYNPVWTGGQSFPKGLVMPQGGNNAHSVIGSFTCYGQATGLSAYEHATATELTTILCGAGLSANGLTAGHNITILKWTSEACNTHLSIPQGNAVGINVVSMQAENISQWTSGNHIDDAGGYAHGRIGFNTSQTSASIAVNGAANLEIIADYVAASSGQQARGVVGPPAVPATTVALKNPYWRHATVYITSGGAAVTVIAVDGTATGLTLGTSGTVMVRVPTGSSITLTYASTAPTWQWRAD